MKAVRIAEAQGMSFSWNFNILSGPKWALKCGECYHTWEQRLPKIDHPTVRCPHCDALNYIPVVYG